MPKIPEKFMGLLGKFADSLDYNDLPQDWANNKQIVAAAEELYRDMGTESPFFKAWFGNSKVVDEAGNPMPVYHQTDADFNVFDFSKARQNSDIPAAFFSSGTEDWADMGGNTIEAYLNVRNPTSKPIVRGHGREAMEDLRAKGHDGTIEAEEDMETEFSAFNPWQIKSTSNRGTFNPADPNIYRSAAPLAVGAGAGAAAMGASDAQASAPYSVPSDIQAQWNSFRQSGKLPEKPLEAPVWSPADLAVAPIGAATTAGKAAAMAADPLMSYGADKLGGLLGYFWGS